MAAPAGSGAWFCDFELVTVFECFDLRSIAGPVALARDNGLSWRTPYLAAAVEETSPGQSHLNHSGHSCARASAATIAATAVTPAIMQARTLIIAPPCRMSSSVSTYCRSGAF